jgi:hypothetical protein
MAAGLFLFLLLELVTEVKCLYKLLIHCCNLDHMLVQCKQFKVNMCSTSMLMYGDLPMLVSVPLTSQVPMKGLFLGIL